MDLLALFCFLFIYFIRPHDWIGFLNGVEVVRPIMLASVAGILHRGGSLSPGTYLKTPLDWIVTLYWGWIIYAAPSVMNGVLQGASLFGFYFLPIAILCNFQRLYRFFTVWVSCLIILALIGIGTVNGFDITSAKEMIDTTFKGRLVINTWLFRNPNSIGHTVIVAIPLLYFLFFYKRQSLKWIWGAILALIAGYCVYLTESKGAFVVGFAIICIALLQGRSLTFRICALALAVTMGWGAVSQLPRMNELSSLRSNEAVMGRMFAWQDARREFEEHSTGAGWKQFAAHFTWEGEVYTIATHSSYIRVGADLGKMGLFLYLLALCTSLRQLFSYRYTSYMEDRLGSILVVLVASYMLSNWMIDRAYHVEFALICGACSAFHRYMLDKWKLVSQLDPSSSQGRIQGELTEENFEAIPVYSSGPFGSLSLVPGGEEAKPALIVPVAESLPPEEKERDTLRLATSILAGQKGPGFLSMASPSAFGVDLLITAVAYFSVLWLWTYAIRAIL